MRTWLTTFALLAGAAAMPATAASKRIYIAPDDHTDYVWSADEAFYADYFVRGLDAYLGQIDATAGNPSATQMRWNADGTHWLKAYEDAKPGAPFDRLMGRVKDGHIGVPMNGLVEVHGGSPAEAVLRDLYYAGRLERRYNFRFDLAIAMENQTMAYGLGALWAGAGAKYSWKGVCACGTRTTGSGDRQYDAYWWVGADGSRILVKWNSLQAPLPGAIDPNGNQGPGGYAEARFARDAVNFVDSAPAFRARFPYDTIGLVGAGWDDPDYIIPLNDSRSFPAIAASLTTPTRDVIVSNVSDFFRDFETRYGATLPSQSVAFGNEWEVSTAAYAAKSARVKRAVEKLRAAEAMATIVSLSNPSFMTSRTAARDAAFEAMGLYFEHDVNGAGPCCSNQQRLDYEERQAVRIESYVDTLHADALAALAQLIPTAAGTNRLFAYNPLGWLRSDVAEAAVPGTEPVYVVDLTTNAQVASETIGSGTARRIRWNATNVPSFGYKVYELRAGLGTLRTSPPTFSGGVLSSAKYRITLDTDGSISSLIDRASANRELVRAVDGLTINDLNSDDGVASGAGTVSLERTGPVSATVRADIGGAVPRTVRVTVFNAIPRIEIEDVITAGFGDAKTYDFALNLDNPLVHHEEVGAVIRARLAPDGEYSPRAQNSLYQWLTMNHFADMSAGDNSYGVTISNGDAYYMRLGHSGFGNLDTTTPRIDVLAGGRANGTDIALIADQGGDTRFVNRFALRPHAAYSQVNAMKTALEHQNPLVVAAVAGPAGATLPATSWQFLKIGAPAQLVWALKPAEEGIAQGVIVRVWNQLPTASNFAASVGAPYRIASTKRTSSIETDLVAPVKPLSVAGNQIATYRLAVQ